jgi:hypothetical protein
VFGGKAEGVQSVLPLLRRAPGEAPTAFIPILQWAPTTIPNSARSENGSSGDLPPAIARAMDYPTEDGCGIYNSELPKLPLAPEYTARILV